jgi:hypothetical protein
MRASHPTAYDALNAVLADLATGTQAALGASFIATYLQGSFAVGDWDRYSDVDFLIVTTRDVCDDEAARLSALHARLFARPEPWAQHLEGSFIPAARLKTPAPAREPLLFLDNGSQALIRSAHCDTFVTRWAVRECGITLAGPPPHTLIDPVAPDALRDEVRNKMRDWHEETLAKPQWLDTRWGQAYCVLQYCRMLHTWHTGRVGSKLAGAQWAQHALDPRWAGLIQRAWAERPNPEEKLRLPASPDDIMRTEAFMSYALTLVSPGDASPR